MLDKDFLEKVSRLGFPLVEAEKGLDVNQTLAEVVQSGDTRLWEGFPVLLANAAGHKNFSAQNVEQFLNKKSDKNHFWLLAALSLALYENRKLKFAWSGNLKKTLLEKESGVYRKNVNQFREFLARNKNFHLGDHQFSPDRLKEFFENYFRKEAVKAKNLRAKLEEYSLEFALSQVFSPKQKELFLKKVQNEPMTKTEKEYYSRTVKRKVRALANPELYRLAQGLLD